MMNDLHLCSLFKTLYSLAWLISFLISLVLIGDKRWIDAKLSLKVGALSWLTGSCYLSVVTTSLSLQELFPKGLTLWTALIPIIMCFSATLLLWYCHCTLTENFAGRKGLNLNT